MANTINPLIEAIRSLQNAKMSFRAAGKPLLVDEAENLIKETELQIKWDAPARIAGLDPLPGLVEDVQ